MGTEYHPKQVVAEHIEMDNEQMELVELLAENTYEHWVQQRIHDGRTFGPTKCDKTRRHPCLVAYADLPDNEKQYDRMIATQTKRTILALGFKIGKGGHT